MCVSMGLSINGTSACRSSRPRTSLRASLGGLGTTWQQRQRGAYGKQGQRLPKLRHAEVLEPGSVCPAAAGHRSGHDEDARCGATGCGMPQLWRCACPWGCRSTELRHAEVQGPDVLACI